MTYNLDGTLASNVYVAAGGSEAWEQKGAGQIGLEYTFRVRGRPKKSPTEID